MTRLAQLRKLLPALLSIACLPVFVLVGLKVPAGIQGSGHHRLYAVGTVTGTGTGSIAVSGMPYSTGGAAFHIDGHPGAQTQIRVGDVVSLVAEPAPKGDGYAASEVTFDGSVEGRVSSIDAPSAVLFVLGQTVRVNANTIFSANLQHGGFAGLQAGERVEVSAYPNAAGELVASYIQGKGHADVAHVIGAIHSLAPAAHTFYINGLKVDYSGAVIKGAINEGVSVSVTGTELAADGSLAAKLVRAEPDKRGEPGAIGRIQGLITAYSSNAYFEVNGQPVIVSPHTRLHLSVPLGLDVPVIAAGTFDTNGALVAETLDSTR